VSAARLELKNPGPILKPGRHDPADDQSPISRGKAFRNSCVVCGEVVTGKVGQNHDGALTPILVRRPRPRGSATFRSLGLYLHEQCVRRILGEPDAEAER
jgi:hypothetical protein